MPKRVKKIEAIPAIEFLDELGKEHLSNPELSAVSMITKSIRDVINIDSCLSENQAKFVELLILTSLNEYNACISIDTLKLPIVTFINTVRLDCYNCLNEACKMRDNTSESMNL